MRLAMCFLLIMVATGCKGPLIDLSKEAQDVARFQIHESDPFDDNTMAQQRSKAARGQVINVLALSGGGAWGAWGAGFLHGWVENTKEPRPESFDLVTGISTGGLQATAAFIGDDSILIRGYTTVDRGDVMRQRFPPLVSALWSPSIYDSAPLGELIQKLITDEVIDRVAEVSHNGERRICVATCELESGELVFWDLSQIAREKQYDLYRCVVLATASIPGVFPPVNIGGHRHVDGGARASVFLDEALSPQLSLEGGDLRIYVIINGEGTISPANPANRTLPVAFRAVSMLLAAQSHDNQLLIQDFAKAHHASFWLSMVPLDYKPVNGHDFDRAEMNHLFEVAKEKSSAEDGWTYVIDQKPGQSLPPYYAPGVEEQMKRPAARR